MTTIEKYVVTIRRKGVDEVVTKEFVTHEEVVTETSDYIHDQAAEHSSRSIYVGIETCVTYWDVNVGEVASYLSTRFIKDYYTTFRGKVTVTLNLRPTNLEREKTVANTITIKRVVVASE